MKIVINKSAINVLKKLQRTDIKVFNITAISFNECEIEITQKDEQKICKLFNLKQSKTIKFYVLCTCVACVFMLIFLNIFSSKYVFNIVVNSNKTEYSEQIKTEIKDNINKFIFSKNSIDLNLVKEQVMKHDNISLCSVNYVGKTLIVNIKFSETNISDKSLSIVSQFEGFVESINVISGTAKVKKGDFVKKGDVLIAPELLANGKLSNISALGQVNILAYYQHKEIFTENKEVLNRTGRKSVKNCFTFKPPKDIMKLGQEKFSLFESETTSQKIKIGGVLPIYKTQITFYELEKLKVFKSFEDNQSLILKEAIEKAKNVVGEKEFYTENATATRLTNGVYEICTTVQFLERIGENK